MSNNKLSIKLYTEEQVDKIALQVYNYGYWDNREVTHIELPSDEEIKEIAIERFPISMEDFGSEKIDGNGYFRSIFIEGIECFRNKIQGGKQ